MTGAELAARCTAASAAAAGFHAEMVAFQRGGRVPDYQAWATRLEFALLGVLSELSRAELPAAGPKPGRDPDLERWLGRQLEQALAGSAGAADLAVVRVLAYLAGDEAETVARWLRQAKSTAEAQAEWTLTLLQLFRDGITWQRLLADEPAAEQQALFRAAADQAGITDAMIGGPEGVRTARPGGSR